MHYSRDKEISRIVDALVKQGWIYRRGRKHGVLVAPTGRSLAVPGTPSDHRAMRNFAHSVRLLEACRGSGASPAPGAPPPG